MRVLIFELSKGTYSFLMSNKQVCWPQGIMSQEMERELTEESSEPTLCSLGNKL